MIGMLRRWWWKRGYPRFYVSTMYATNVYAANSRTRERFEVLAADLYSTVKPNPNDTVLDLGAGDGRLTTALFKDCKRVVLLDFCEKAKDLQDELPGNMQRVFADMCRVPFQPATFNTVFTYGALLHATTQRHVAKLLKDWDGLLTAGGTLYIGDIADRGAIPYVIRDCFYQSRGLGPVRALKKCFATLMCNYFSRQKLGKVLTRLGYQVTVINQTPKRRFFRERFDIRAVKGEGAVNS